ncbi:DUF2207 family protein [Paramicrobacterium chengjingii]|uniref:DUF2207 domain-containing protein n=1 Tax=Paramicrobacterium chengjingii TaxID=2769067 RepID=A0ABX6YJF9_9MICO|nr:DUF2207 domain-containing protein [Microbacterium chengjingii]QPZ38892.1 DUF2207 domain-containing protein [Microbacterium chengjingii]
MERIARIIIVAGAASVGAMLTGPAAVAAGATTAPAFAAIGPVAGDVDDFDFRSLDVDYTIGRDDDGGSMLEVVEEFTADFPDFDQNHGMRRSIPDTYNGQPLEPELVSITDADGNEFPAETDSEDGTFQMTARSDNYLHGTQTFVFTYTLRHVTWSFDDTDADEFYWDVNGVDWVQPFGSVAATLHVPADLVDALTDEQSCYKGAQGATEQCTISATTDADGAAIVTASAYDLSPYETMSISVGFEQGTFTPYDTSFFARPWGWLQLLATIAAIALIIPAIVTRVRTLKDAPGRPTIIAEYEPPQGIDALQAAVFLGKKAKAIPAEVLEQAVTGSIRILEGKRKLFGGTRLQAQLLDPSRADADGRMLLYGLFGGAPAGAIFEFGSTDRRFSKVAQDTLTWAKDVLKRRGVRRTDLSKAGKGTLLVSFLVMLVSIGFGAASLVLHVDPGLPIALLLASIAAFVVCLLLVAYTPLSSAGAELRDHLKGLEEFIRWAEADRIRMLQSPSGAERRSFDPTDARQVLHLYEKLLPFAVIFGQEKQWADQLVVLYQYTGSTTPEWYYGTGGFNASAFSSGISTLSTSAVASSSSTGGSSGGGSAGGGGGGGGGGGV